MKKNHLWLLLTGVLILILIVAGVLYGRLTDDYDADNLAAPSPDTTVTDDTAQSTPTDSTAIPSPDFTVLDIDGNDVSLSDFRGKPVVINFWATWCGYCKVEMPDFQLAYERHPEVQFMMINATDGQRETIDSAKAYIESEGFTFDVFFDTQQSAVSAYRVSAFPTTYFVDKDGHLVTYASGLLDAKTLEKGIAMLDK